MLNEEVWGCEMLIYFKPSGSFTGRLLPATVSDGWGQTSIKGCPGAQRKSYTTSWHSAAALFEKYLFSKKFLERSSRLSTQNTLLQRKWQFWLNTDAESLGFFCFVFLNKIPMRFAVNRKKCGLFEDSYKFWFIWQRQVDIMDMWREGVWDYIMSLNILKHV